MAPDRIAACEVRLLLTPDASGDCAPEAAGGEAPARVTGLLPLAQGAGATTPGPAFSSPLEEVGGPVNVDDDGYGGELTAPRVEVLRSPTTGLSDCTTGASDWTTGATTGLSDCTTGATTSPTAPTTGLSDCTTGASDWTTGSSDCTTGATTGFPRTAAIVVVAGDTTLVSVSVGGETEGTDGARA